MKNSIDNLHEALVFLVNRMYDAERKLQKSLPRCLNHATTNTLVYEIKKYNESSDDKLTKLERVFNYLMVEPTEINNKPFDILLEDLDKISHLSSSEFIKDTLIISCLQNLIHYKISVYGAARTYASELELETPADLLREILEWEKEKDKILTKLAVTKVNIKDAESVN
ncbi:MAG: ferritin-like domain-containing protein [Candidatus Cyclobacteriaceae bacterium M2_1C_046]